MASAPVLYQETRVPTNPSPSSFLHINAAGTNAVTSSLRVGRKRGHDEISGLDEEAYARKYLATEGSVFFRPKAKSPRSFLWRVLDERQVLEIQCVDVVESQHQQQATPSADAPLAFQVTFAAGIMPNGVVLADAAERDALEVFVLTGSQELYTITLRRDLLTRHTIPTDFDSSSCVKKFASSSFAYKHPYRFVAFSSLELFISFHDGSMLRLERDASATGAQWRETHFSEGGWSGSLKRSFPFAKPQTARYGDIDLYSDSVAAIAKSPDGEHIWTVSLDHKLKAWNTQSGKVDVTGDLLKDVGQDEDRQKAPTYMMSPEQGTILQIIPQIVSEGTKAVARADDKKSYCLALHSPKDHQFKIYFVNGDLNRMEDAVPDAKLIPPMDDLMDTTMWHLEDFVVHPGLHWRQSQLWLRARSGSLSRTFLLTFDLNRDGHDSHQLDSLFQTGWTEVDTYYQSIDMLKRSVQFCALDAEADSQATISERWLDFLFYPGRFSEASLATALQIYGSQRKLSTTSKRKLHVAEEPLKCRIINAVSAKIILHRTANEQPDYHNYQLDLHTQWTVYFALLSHLHSRRHEPIGFSFDHETGLPWTICADYVAPVRASSTFELLSLNSELLINGEISTAHDSVQGRIFPTDDDTIASQILAVARQLRHYFSAPSQAKLRDIAVMQSLDQSDELPGEDGLNSIYNQCHFQEEIRDSDYDAITETADEFNGLGSVTDDNIMMILEKLEENVTLGAELKEKPGHFGERLAISIARETVQLTQATLLDILSLIVFMHGDLEQGELSRDFRPVEMYEAIMLALRHSELRLWLISNVRQKSSSAQGRPSEVRSLYECLFLQDWLAKRDRHHSDLPHLITAWNKAWTFGLALSEGWNGVTAHILADLLKHQETELAQEFLVFLPETWWTTYLRARLHLAAGEYALAALSFNEAADECARTSAPQNALLTAEEVNYFQAGRGPYYQHIMSLFERLKEYSYTAEFATQALANFQTDESLQDALERIDERKQSKDSPAKVKVSNAMDELGVLKEQKTKEDVRNRLFNALVQTGRFESAYAVLTDIKNPALQTPNLHALIHTCVKREAISTLLELPISGDFVQSADSILLEMAKKSMKMGLPSGPPYHQILFAFRTQHSDFRGAAAILYEHMEHLQKKSRTAIQDPEDETLLRIYVLLINTLACCSENEAWLLADPIPGLHDVNKKRRLVTLEDIRRDYVAELDRRSDILQGRFPLIGHDDEDVEMF